MIAGRLVLLCHKSGSARHSGMFLAGIQPHGKLVESAGLDSGQKIAGMMSRAVLSMDPYSSSIILICDTVGLVACRRCTTAFMALSLPLEKSVSEA